MSEEGDLWLANLEEWVSDDNKVITAKALSRDLRIHINVAKERLFLFLKKVKDGEVSSLKYDDLAVVYLLAGKSKVTGKRKVCLVTEEKVKAKEKDFDGLTSKHIDSIAKKAALKDDLVHFNAQMEVILRDPYLTTFGAITNKAAVPRNGGLDLVERVAQNNKPKIEMKPKTTSNETKVKEEKTEAPKASTKPEEKEKPKPKKGGKANIAGMFANMAAKKPAKPAPKAAESSPEVSPGKENRENEAKEKEEVKANAKKRPNQSKKLESKPKRKRIQMMADSDSSDDEDEVKEEEEDIKVEDSPPPPQAKLIVSDDDEDDEDLIPPTPDNNPKVNETSKGRKRSHKKVKKTFMDDKGFMVTKEEMESCSESDEEEVKVKSEPEVKKKPEPVVKPPSKAKKAAPSPKKQATIMNFFKKKA